MGYESLSNEGARLIDQYRLHQEELRKRQKHLQFRRKMVRLFIIVGLLLLCLIFWKGPRWYREFMKRRMAFRFLYAVLSKDGQTLYELISPEERHRTRMTPERAAAVAKRLLAYLGEVKPVRIELETYPPRPKEGQIVKGPGGVEYRIIYPQNPTFPEERTWIVYWGDQNGELLQSWWAQTPNTSEESPYLTSKILIIKLKSGFWVDYGYFILTTCISKWGEKEGLQMTKRIWQESDIEIKGGRNP